jgi:Icc protein
MKFVQLSDTHIVAPGGRLHGLDPRRRLEACVTDINAHHPDAAFCIVSGDLAHEGDPAAYAVLREVLDDLSMPCHLMIGNHDHRGRFQQAFSATGRDPGGFVQYVVATPLGDFLLLDTVEPGSDAGRYCGRRLAWLAERLEESRERGAWLFMHHPPFDIGIPSLDRIRLLDPEPLSGLIDAHDHVRHLFFGHVHRPVSGSWRGIPFSAVRGTNHQVAFDQHTERPVPKSHESPAYAVVFANEENTVVHFHDYLAHRVLKPGEPLPADSYLAD